MPRTNTNALLVYCDDVAIAKFNKAREIASLSKSAMMRNAIDAYAEAVLQQNAKSNHQQAIQEFVNNSYLKEQTNVR